MSEEKAPYRIEGRPATIFRTVKSTDNPYVVIDRRPVDNKGLSWKAKGILTYLMSRPDGWEVSIADLTNRSTDGEDAVRSGVKELRAAGHLKYISQREHGRFTGWLIEVYEVPNQDTSPYAGFPDVEKPDVENPTQVLKTPSSNESSRYDNEQNQQTERQPSIFQLYEQNVGAIVPMLAEDMKAAEREYPYEWFPLAFKIAVENNARNWKYVSTVLKNMKSHGVGWKPVQDKKPAYQQPKPTVKPKIRSLADRE
jgi:DnaD/phage-associated family protein